MPEYLSPGVYIEEIPGPQPIQGVSTSTTGMVGVTQKGPVRGKPVFIDSFGAFRDTFGSFLPAPGLDEEAKWRLDDREGGLWWQFPLAVKGFFDNGGRRLFVKRVVSSTATAAETTIGTAAVAPPGDDDPDAFTLAAADDSTDLLRAVAQAPGGWGTDLSVRVRPQIARRIPILDGAGRSGPLATTLNADVDQAATTATLKWPDRIVDNIGQDDRVQLVIGGATFTLAALPAVDGGIATVTLPNPPGVRLRRGTPVKILRRAAQPGNDNTLRVTLARMADEAIYPGALVLVGPGRTRATVTGRDNGRIVITGQNLPPVFETELIAVVEAQVVARYRQAPVQGAPAGQAPEVIEETFNALRLAPLEKHDGSIVDVVNENSRLISLEVVPEDGDLPTLSWDAFPGSADDNGFAPLTGGADNNEGLRASDFAGADGGSGNRTGIQALEDIEEISICAVPGMWSTTVQSALIAHCEQLRDRFAILDPQVGLGVQDVQAFRERLESQFAALYHPWLSVTDPLTAKPVDTPPSGHMAGVYARVDVLRGVHKAPANETVQQILSFVDDINQREQDILNPVGINALRFFKDRGLRVWGARTLSATPEWRYINVRRLFIFIEESIRLGTQWVVFEPNNEDLWALVRQSVTNFLDTVWRTGALMGTKQAEAFYVQCDRSTMSQDDIDNGRLIVEIGIAPTKPAEFVVFRFRQKTVEQVAAV